MELSDGLRRGIFVSAYDKMVKIVEFIADFWNYSIVTNTTTNVYNKKEM